MTSTNQTENGQPTQTEIEHIHASCKPHDAVYFDEIAAKYCNGNRSQLFRSAVYHYGDHLENGGNLDLKRIQRELADVATQLPKIVDLLEIVLENQARLEAQSNSERLLNVDDTDEMGDARAVRVAIQESSDSTLSADGIVEATNLSPPRIQAALHLLFDRGYVEPITLPNRDWSYRLTGTDRQDGETQ